MFSFFFLSYFLLLFSLVPNGPRAATSDDDVCIERQWRDEAIDDFYKGKMPNWLTKDELAAATDKGQYYEVFIFLVNFALLCLSSPINILYFSLNLLSYIYLIHSCKNQIC